MAAIVCPTDCSAALPAVSFDKCNPEINASEIIAVYISKGNSAPLTNFAQAAEWTNRMGTPTDPDDKIIELIVSAEKPAPEKQERDISNFRKVVINKTHTINVEIDETNQTNYDFVRNLECGGQYRVWYKTASGHMHGGNEGCGNAKANVFLDVVHARGESEITKIVGSITWKAKNTEERAVSPI